MENMERVWKELVGSMDVDMIKDKFREFKLEHMIEEFNKRLDYTLEDITMVQFVNDLKYPYICKFSIIFF